MEFMTWDKIIPGSVWVACDGSNTKVKVTEVNPREVQYRDSLGNRRDKDPFSFQCRYQQTKE